MDFEESEKGVDGVDARRRRLLAEYGHFVQHVLGGGEALPYSYTSGLSYAQDVRLPELAMAGFDHVLMQRLLNDAVAMMKSGAFRPSGPCMLPRLIVGYDVAVVPVRPRGACHMTLPETAEAYLVGLPDAAGLFPWDGGCDPGFARQVEGFDVIALPSAGAAPPGA